MEGDNTKCYICKHYPISTHALTWRATGSWSKRRRCARFLPTPSRGGRLLDMPLLDTRKDFYPRPHVEGDLSHVHKFLRPVISTHALTWRATRVAAFGSAQPMRFLPTPSRGGRRFDTEINNSKMEFLPTPSRGGRRLRVPWLSLPIQFLPTPSRGGRLEGTIHHVQGEDISTHALTWRATCEHPRAEKIFVFLPTPSRGGRLLHGSRASLSRDFYPRPHVEGDKSQTNMVQVHM